MIDGWKEIHPHRFERPDGAVVIYDESTACDTARPWLPNHRGYKAFGPGDDEFNYLGYYRKDSRFYIPRKFKTPEAAMLAVNKLYPIKEREE